MATRESLLSKTSKPVITFFKNATVRYVGGVLFLLLLGAFGQVLGYAYFQEGTFERSLSLSFSEAALVSAILAMLVDPFLKRRIQDEAAWSGVFGYLNERAPQGLRKALRELATCSVYSPRTTWTLTFDWENAEHSILTLTVDVNSTNENIGRKAHKLDGKLWMLGSTAGYQSRYLRYRVSCPGVIDSVDLLEDELQEFISFENDGTIVVDEARASKQQSIPPGKTFEIVKRACMYRHVNGHIPLHHGKFGEHLKIVLQGNAFEAIDVRVSHPDHPERGNTPTERHHTAAMRPTPFVTHFQRITPGQVTLVSWKLTASTIGDAVPEEPAEPSTS